MKNRNTYNLFKLGFFLMLLLGLTSCLGDSFKGCPDLAVRVVLAASEDIAGEDGSDRDDLTAANIENVTLYVFDQEQNLIDMRPTAINRIELLNYPQAESFHFVALANVMDNCSNSEPARGDHVSSGEVSVVKSQLTFCGMDMHECPDELFWGDLDALNDGSQTGLLDLPVKRMVAGVHVRVFGLREHMENNKGIAGDDYAGGDFSVVLGSGSNVLNYLGETSCNLTRGADDPVNHISAGKTQALENGTEVFNLPGQPDDTGAAANYFPVLSTYEGSPVSVGLYHGESLITADIITTDYGGKPLKVYNNKLNVIDITFRTDGTVTVRVSQCAWNGVLDIEVEF